MSDIKGLEFTKDSVEGQTTPRDIVECPKNWNILQGGAQLKVGQCSLGKKKKDVLLGAQGVTDKQSSQSRFPISYFGGRRKTKGKVYC